MQFLKLESEIIDQHYITTYITNMSNQVWIQHWRYAGLYESGLKMFSVMELPSRIPNGDGGGGSSRVFPTRAKGLERGVSPFLPSSTPFQSPSPMSEWPRKVRLVRGHTTGAATVVGGAVRGEIRIKYIFLNGSWGNEGKLHAGFTTVMMQSKLARDWLKTCTFYSLPTEGDTV